jgi:hypothetical protein
MHIDANVGKAPAPRSQHWVYDDGGRAAAGYKGNASDCVCRAIAIATEQPYRKVYDELSAFGWFPGNGMKRGEDGLYRSRPDNEERLTLEYLAELGWVWTPTRRIGSGCRVHLRADELPPGRLIASVSRHLYRQSHHRVRGHG